MLPSVQMSVQCLVLQPFQKDGDESSLTRLLIVWTAIDVLFKPIDTISDRFVIFLLESVDLCNGVVLNAHFGEGSYEVSFEAIIRLFCLRFQSLKPR